MPSPRSRQPLTTAQPPARSYTQLLTNVEFAGLYASFTLTVAAGALSGLALGTLVHARTGSALLTAISMYGATFAAVVGALTLMSVADGNRPRRILLVLQSVSLVAVAGQAVPGLPLAARFGLLLALGFLQSLGTGARMGLLAELVPTSSYALARSLMNITSGLVAVVALAVGAALLATTGPGTLFVIAAVLTGIALLVVAATIRERSVRISRRPGVRQTWATNRALLARADQRVLLVNLWVPNGLVVGCEALFISYSPDHAGWMLAAGSAGMLIGDLAVGRFMGVEQRRRRALALRVLLAGPYLLFVLHPGVLLASAVVLVSSAGFAATLPLQERLLELVPDAVRGQVQGVESAGRMTWQGIGAVLAGLVAQLVPVGLAMVVVAGASLAVTVTTRSAVSRAGVGRPSRGAG
jgi:predicted MFS family arabinose efflux permease